MNSLTEVSGEEKSEWEEGLAVIREILKPGSDAHEALSERQRKGLWNVQKILIGDKESESEFHLPSDLRRVSLHSGESAIDDYLLSQFAGVRHKSAKQKLKSVVNATKFISGLKTLTGSEASDMSFKKNMMWSYLPTEWEDFDMDTRRQVADMLSLESLADWGFDVFKLHELTHGNALLFIGYGILSSPYSQHAMRQNVLGANAPEVDVTEIKGYRFLEEFNISAKTMVNFLRAIQNEYIDENPYHNSVHAADVTQSMHSLLSMGGDRFSKAEIELFSVLLAAVIHDVAHPGTNNNFQINCKSEYALQYNDQSVLENMHLSRAFSVVLGSGGNAGLDIFKKMKPMQYSSVRSMVIKAVLHTDMTKHFVSVNQLKGLIVSNSAEGLIGSSKSFEVLSFLLHLADISNQSKPGRLFERWTDLCLEEFFRQGDEEKKLGLPVSPLCDRASTDRAGSQIGFIQVIILPAFKVIGKCIPKVEEIILPNIENNLDFWILESKRGPKVEVKGKRSSLPPEAIREEDQGNETEEEI